MRPGESLDNTTGDARILIDVPGLIARPGFDEAMLAAAAAFVSFYRGNWLLNRVANDRGRVIAAMMMIDLHFFGGKRGFTVSQLRDQARRYGVCSPNRMTALAALLRVGGFLAPVPGGDSRQRKLAPSQAMFDLHRARLHGLLSANALIQPDIIPAITAIEDNDVLGDMVAVYVDYWRAGDRAIGDDPLLNAVIDRDAGLTVLFLMLLGTSRGESFRVSDLARQFAISRTHALVIMREATKHGCLRQTVPGGPYQGTPELSQVMRPFFARIFHVQADAARQALQRRAARSARQSRSLPLASG
jgi:hypothetical protein